jgi:predicted dinucleotide-binding enzyme
MSSARSVTSPPPRSPRQAGQPAHRTRQALAIAGDDREAKHAVAAIYDAVGFDMLDLGGLDDAWRVDRGQPAFITRQDLAQLKANVDRADRSRSGR